MGDDPEMHTFWTLALAQTTTCLDICNLCAEKLSFPAGHFQMYCIQNTLETLVKSEELMLPLKLKKDEEGVYTFIVRSKSKEQEQAISKVFLIYYICLTKIQERNTEEEPNTINWNSTRCNIKYTKSNNFTST